jgi:AbiV family abortive infection protein
MAAEVIKLAYQNATSLLSDAQLLFEINQFGSPVTLSISASS